MHRCNKCDEAITEDRIKAFLTQTGKLPDECLNCSQQHTEPVLGFMAMSGEHGARKVGAELVTVSPVGNPNYKEHVRQAKRIFMKRGISSGR